MIVKWYDQYTKKPLSEVRELMATWTSDTPEIIALTYDAYADKMQHRFVSLCNYEMTHHLSLLRQDLCERYLSYHPDFSLVSDIVCAPVANLLSTPEGDMTRTHSVRMADLQEILYQWKNQYPSIYKALSISFLNDSDRHYFMNIYKIWKAVRYHHIDPSLPCFRSFQYKTAGIQPEMALLWREKDHFLPLIEWQYPELMDVFQTRMKMYQWSDELLHHLSKGVDGAQVFTFCERWQEWINEKAPSFTGGLRQATVWGYVLAKELDWYTLLTSLPSSDGTDLSEVDHLYC